MASSSYANAASKDAFHHYIPRATLNEFIIDKIKDTASNRHNRTQMKRESRERVKDETPQRFIYVYDINKRRLEKCSPGKAYGIENLYVDCENITEVEYVERLFSSLEEQASDTLNKIHENVGLKTPNLELTRKEYESLRKFIFLMDFRTEQVSMRNFKESNPAAYEAKRMALLGLSPLDALLKVHQFILEHPQIYFIKTIKERLSPGESFMDHIQDLFDDTPPGFLSGDIEHREWAFSRIYLYYTELYHWGICQAADGHEFVLSNKSYGLMEGPPVAHPPAPPTHRLYIMSPKIALLLRQTPQLEMFDVFEDENDFGPSELFDIPVTPAVCEYHGFKFTSTDPLIVQSLVLDEYRATSAADKDRFGISFVKLTPQQTFNVNKVVLSQLTKSLTFRSEKCMHVTLLAYLAQPIDRSNKHLFVLEPLLAILSNNPSGTPLTGLPLSEFQSLPHIQDLSAVSISHAMTMPRYERAWVSFARFTGREEKYARLGPLRGDLDSLLSQSANVLNRELPRGYYPRRLFRLITTGLPEDKANIVFTKSKDFIVNILGVQIHGEGENEDKEDEMYTDILVIGWIKWLAENRDDHLTDILAGVNTPQERRVQLLDFIL